MILTPACHEQIYFIISTYFRLQAANKKQVEMAITLLTRGCVRQVETTVKKDIHHLHIKRQITIISNLITITSQTDLVIINARALYIAPLPISFCLDHNEGFKKIVQYRF